MRNFLIRAIISAIALYITANIIPGINVTENIVTLLVIGMIIGIVNAIVKPLLVFLTCPAVLLTLGLFILVINALMLQLAAWFSGDAFNIDGFGAAFLGGIVMGIINMVLEGVLDLDDQRGKRVEHKRKIPRQ